MASVSRLGSGSSCRSFEGPWVLWEGADARAVPGAAYVDLVLLVASLRKDVSSSAAHAAVTGSPLWTGRTDRAGDRARRLRGALAQGAAAEVARVAWAELWDMHSLFHTSPEPFSYWLPQSLEILLWLKPFAQNGTVVTMDAGPNVHLLVPPEQVAAWRERIAARFPGLTVLEDRAGSGAGLI